MGNCCRFVKKKKQLALNKFGRCLRISIQLSSYFGACACQMQLAAQCANLREQTKCCLISFLNLGKPRKTKRTSKNLLLIEETSYNSNKIKIQFQVVLFQHLDYEQSPFFRKDSSVLLALLSLRKNRDYSQSILHLRLFKSSASISFNK